MLDALRLHKETHGHLGELRSRKNKYMEKHRPGANQKRSISTRTDDEDLTTVLQAAIHKVTDKATIKRLHHEDGKYDYYSITITGLKEEEFSGPK